MDYCRRCLECCPQNAISFTEADISFDSSRCSECALCAADCPTEAFIHDSFAPLELIRSIDTSSSENGELDLYCHANNPDQQEPNNLRIPCHGLLDHRLLVGLHTAGVKQLSLHGLDRCDKCPTRVGAQRLAQTFEKAPVTLRNHFPSLHDISVRKDADSKNSQEPMDRRKFLDAAIKGAVNMATFTALSSLPGGVLQDRSHRGRFTAPESNECSVKHLPQSHRLALSNLQSGGISIADIATIIGIGAMSDSANPDAWFYEVHAYGSCNVCGICCLICPTGALTIEDSDKNSSLYHQTGSCIGCGLCSTLCPQEALQLLAASDDAPVLDNRTVMLHECERISCESCGRSFVQPDDHTTLCQSCNNEQAVRDQWLDEAGNID